MANVVTGGFGKPPKPVAGLDDQAVAIWNATVGCWPADHFKPSDFPLLAEYCRALVCAEELNHDLAKARTVYEMKAVLDLRDREVRRAAALSRTLRIAPQSRYDRHALATAARHVNGKRPWLDPDDPASKFFND